jgi:hypothetical protein
MHSRHDTNGRAGLGILSRDQRNTPALVVGLNHSRSMSMTSFKSDLLRLQKSWLGKELEDAIQLHCLWHLIAGAIQEEELVQQPDYAFTYAKLDRAIIWDG